MIPQSEWKFLEGTEHRIQHVEAHAIENEIALMEGGSPPWDPSEIAARKASILQEMDYPNRVEQASAQDPTPEEARRLELHRLWVLRTLFETHPDLFDLTMDLQEETLAFRPEVSGRPVLRSQIAEILATEPDRAVREEAWRSMIPLGERIEERLAELVRRRDLLAQSVAGTGFPRLATHALELDRATLVGALDAFERSTRRAYQEAKTEIAQVLDVKDLEPWDLDFGMNALGAIRFPADKAVEAALALAKRWGFSADLVKVKLSEDLPLSRLVARTGDGTWNVISRPNAIDIFRAVGEAAHGSAVLATRPFLRGDAPALVTASGLFFAGMLEDEGWLTEAGVPAPERRRHVRAAKLSRLLALRRSAALVAFENLLYPNRSVDPRRLFAEVEEQMLELTRRTEAVWPAHTEILFRPFSQGTEILASMIAAGFCEALGETWTDPKSGDWLRERVMASGASVRWEEKLAASGVVVEIEPLARELGIHYAGPELGESEEASDRAVEEYFKDLDL